MQELKMGVASAEEETQAVMKVYSKEDYSVVNRFESKFMKTHIFFFNIYRVEIKIRAEQPTNSYSLSYPNSTFFLGMLWNENYGCTWPKT